VFGRGPFVGSGFGKAYPGDDVCPNEFHAEHKIKMKITIGLITHEITMGLPPLDVNPPFD
jgi:hypothetical protein